MTDIFEAWSKKTKDSIIQAGSNIKREFWHYTSDEVKAQVPDQLFGYKVKRETILAVKGMGIYVVSCELGEKISDVPIEIWEGWVLERGDLIDAKDQNLYAKSRFNDRDMDDNTLKDAVPKQLFGYDVDRNNITIVRDIGLDYMKAVVILKKNSKYTLEWKDHKREWHSSAKGWRRKFVSVLIPIPNDIADDFFLNIVKDNYVPNTLNGSTIDKTLSKWEIIDDKNHIVIYSSDSWDKGGKWFGEFNYEGTSRHDKTLDEKLLHHKYKVQVMGLSIIDIGWWEEAGEMFDVVPYMVKGEVIDHKLTKRHKEQNGMYLFVYSKGWFDDKGLDKPKDKDKDKDKDKSIKIPIGGLTSGILPYLLAGGGIVAYINTEDKDDKKIILSALSIYGIYTFYENTGLAQKIRDLDI